VCGITALVVQRGRDVELHDLASIDEGMVARGPDGHGSWISQCRRVGLSHRRLAVIDLSENAAQPMRSSDGNLTIVFNGEIYNYQELRRSLQNDGSVFRSTSDTEVLLSLYRRHGKQMLGMLRGMYAFALWDDVRKELFAARDPFGIKPLYFANTGEMILVASQVKALLRHPSVSRELDPAGQVGFYLLGQVPEPFTMLRQIEALPAGHYMIVTRESLGQPKSFTDLHSLLTAPATIAYDAERMIGLALSDTVKAHSVADVPVSLFLSAGIDSCAIAATAPCEGLQAHTLSYYDPTIVDESEGASAFAKRLALKHSVHVITREDFHQELSTLLEAMDQPSIDGVNTYFISKLARASGVKVALSGLGGDELLGGYSTFQRVPRLLRWGRLFGVPWYKLGPILRILTANLFSKLGIPKHAGLLEFSEDSATAYFLLRGLMMPWELHTVLAPSVIEDGLQRLSLLDRMRESAGVSTSIYEQVRCLELTWYMKNQLLRDSDWASMAHSLELRVPLVDSKFLKASLNRKADSQRLGKRDLANSARLPKYIVERPKSGFSIPVDKWAQELASSTAETLPRGLRSWARFVYRAYVNQVHAAGK